MGRGRRRSIFAELGSKDSSISWKGHISRPDAKVEHDRSPMSLIDIHVNTMRRIPPRTTSRPSLCSKSFHHIQDSYGLTAYT